MIKKYNKINNYYGPYYNNGIFEKSRQKRWNKYQGMTYNEACCLLEQWRWDSQKATNLLKLLIKQIKKSGGIFFGNQKDSKKFSEILNKCENYVDRPTIWTKGF